jgi:serine protease inhibitor
VSDRTSRVQHSWNFRADHAFVFLIRDVRSKAILFVGRLSDPS